MTVSETPEILWHYTTFETMTKIVQSGELLASNYLFLNDTSEIISGFTMCLEWLRAHSDDAVKALAEDENFIQALRRDDWPYILSFSEAKDSLSMWRGYGDAVNGNTGVTIGFSYSDLEDLSCGQIFESPKKCEYEALAFSGKLDEVYERKGCNAPVSSIYGDLTKAIPLGKNRHFREEQEWRLLGNVMPRKDNCILKEIGGVYRASFDLREKRPNGESIAQNPLAIKEIKAGPKTSLDKLRHYVEIAFPKLGLNCPTISKSDIPFV